MAGGMSSLGGFLSGFLPPIEKRITELHDQDEAQNAEQRKIRVPQYYAAAAAGASPEVLDSLAKGLKPFMSKKAYEHFLQAAKLGTNVIGKLQGQQQGGQQQSQSPQQVQQPIGQNVMSGSPGSMKATGTGQTAQPPQQQSVGAQALSGAPENPFFSARKAEDAYQNQQADVAEQRKIKAARDMIPVDVEKQKALLPGDVEKAKAIAQAQATMESEQFKTKISEMQKFMGREFSPEELSKIALHQVGISGEEGASSEKIDIKGPDGKTQVAFRDPKSGKIFDADHHPIDMAKGYQVVEKETTTNSAEVKDLKRLAELKRKADPTPEEKDELQALEYRKKQLDDASHRADTRLNVTVQNAARAAGGGDASSEQIPDWLRAQAEDDYMRGKTRSFGLGKSKTRDMYNRAQAEFVMTNPQARADAADFKAGTANLQSLERMQGSIGSFENAFQDDLKNTREAAARVPRSKAKAFNTIDQLWTANTDDDPDLAALSAFTQTLVNQYARLVSNGGVVTDTGRAEGKAILDKAMPGGSFSAAINAMEKEAKNRVNGIKTEIEKQKARLASPGSKAIGGPGDEDKMIKVQIPGMSPGQIHASQKDAFLKKYPNAKVLP